MSLSIRGHTYLIDFTSSIWKAEWVLWLPASVCPPVRSSVCKLYVALTITRHIFDFESPNLHRAFILSAGIENEGHWSWPSMSFWQFWLRILGNSACAQLITYLGWDHQICTKHSSCDALGWYWKRGPLTLTFKVIWLFWLRIARNRFQRRSCILI